MISMNAIGSAGGAASYYTTEQAAIEYYADEAVPSQWHGQGAEINGLDGGVKAEDLTRILEGKVKEVTKDAQGNEQTTEKQLGRTVIDEKTGERKSDHRAGWDLTFSAPKSVSIEAEIFGNKEMRQAHEAAVLATMDWLEKDGAQTRINGKRVETGNLTYATFSHATSREGDPQTHTHVLVANLTYVDGKAYSLSNERLMQMRTTADAVYKNELASRAQKLGYALEYDDRGNFEIKGYDKTARDQFSKRSEQIKGSLEERGHDVENASYEARQAATLATRQEKAEGHSESAAAHRGRWQAEAKEAFIERVKAVDPQQLKSDVTAKDLIDSAISSVAEREQVFAKKDLVKEAMLQSSGRVSSDELLKEIEGRAESGSLIRREQDKSGARYTTSQAIAGELWADKQISAGREGHTHVMNEKEFQSALAKFEERKGFHLKDEQREAARSILTGSDQFQAVQGSAGTGKTTMVEFIREAAESKGWSLKGMATGAAQAEKLEQESGITSTTTASFLASKREEPGGTTKTLFIVDEASLAGQKEFNGILGATIKEGARTVFLGDKDQHQSVTAGAALERAMGTLDEPKMQVDYLREITRQTTTEAKEAVSLIMSGNHAEAIKKTGIEYSAERVNVMAKWDALAEKQGGKLDIRQTETKREEIKQSRIKDNERVIQAIAKDYAAQPAERRTADEGILVITATNADRRALNEAIRAEIKGRGELQGGVMVNTLRGKDMTEAQRGQASGYALGDVLKKETKKTVTHYTVTGTDTTKNTILVKDERGQSLSLKSNQFSTMTAYTQLQQEFATGDRVSFLENSTRAGLKNGKVGTVQSIDGNVMQVRIGGATKEVDLNTYKQIDHGYVATSHKSQGQTVQEAWVHHNTEGGMHGQREAYVNTTRARLKTVTYTQDRDKASKQASAEINKTTATRKGPKRTAKATREQETAHQQEQAAAAGLSVERETAPAVMPQKMQRREIYEGVEQTPARDQDQTAKAPAVIREKHQTANQEQAAKPTKGQTAKVTKSPERDMGMSR